MRAIAWMAAAALLVATSAGADRLSPGQPAPAAELTLVDGGKVQLADLKGDVVILNFWATWCVPCRAELPLLDAYYRRLASQGLRIFAISTEDTVPVDKLKPLFATLAIPAIGRVQGLSTDVAAVPTSYIVDRRGIVRHIHRGALGIDDLDRLIPPLLRERAD